MAMLASYTSNNQQHNIIKLLIVMSPTWFFRGNYGLSIMFKNSENLNSLAKLKKSMKQFGPYNSELEYGAGFTEES